MGHINRSSAHGQKLDILNEMYYVMLKKEKKRTWS